MATFNELIFDIMETMRGNKVSDDTDLSERNIVYHLNNQRALWLRNEYNKSNRKIDPQIEQDLGCLKIVEVDAAECCTVDLGCTVLRTELQIPNLLELHSGPAVTRVGPVHKLEKPFNFMEYNQAIYASAGKYSGRVTVAFLLNDFIYMIIKDPAYQNLEYINLRGVFTSPTDLIAFQCDEGACFSYDDEYPINSWMIPYIKEQILNQFGMSLQIPKDTTNDAKEDLTRK